MVSQAMRRELDATTASNSNDFHPSNSDTFGRFRWIQDLVSSLFREIVQVSPVEASLDWKFHFFNINAM